MGYGFIFLLRIDVSNVLVWLLLYVEIWFLQGLILKYFYEQTSA